MFSNIHIQVNLVIARVDITRIWIQHDLVLDPIFPQSLRFFFYTMKSSHLEKNLSHRLVNTVEISVNRVVVIIKMGCTTFRRKSFRRYDFLSHTTFGRCDFPSSTTFSRKKYPGTTFRRNGQLNYFITNHLRNQFTLTINIVYHRYAR